MVQPMFRSPFVSFWEIVYLCARRSPLTRTRSTSARLLRCQRQGGSLDTGVDKEGRYDRPPCWDLSSLHFGRGQLH